MFISRNTKGVDPQSKFPYRIKGSSGTINENDIALGTYETQTPPGSGPYTVEFGPSNWSVTITASGIQSPDALVGITACPESSSNYLAHVSDPAKS